MNLPQFKLLVESITDRNALMDAIKKGDKEAAMKAISSLMRNKRVYNTPAQELGVEESEFRTIVNAVKAGDLKKAGEAMGVGDEYTQRGPFAGQKPARKQFKKANPGEAVYMMTLPSPGPGVKQVLFNVNPPLEALMDDEKYEYVVVSQNFQETLIFPADYNGIILNWGELRGSSGTRIPHEDALEDAGYKVVGYGDILKHGKPIPSQRP